MGDKVKLKDIEKLDKIALNSYLSYYKKPINNQFITDLKEEFLQKNYFFLSRNPKHRTKKLHVTPIKTSQITERGN